MTKQVRIGAELHKKLRILAAEEDTTILRLLEKICKDFFEKTHHQFLKVSSEKK